MTTGLRPPLKVRWQINFGGPVSYPLAVNGIVYVVAGNSAILYALDAVTGRTVWARAAPTGYGSWLSPAYDSGKIYAVASGSPVANSGAMFAFDGTSGRTLWRATLPGNYSFTTAPTAYGGLVYTSGTGGYGTVFAVREADGSLAWTGSVEGGDASPPAVTSSGAYVAYGCPQAYRFGGTTGTPVWHFDGACTGGFSESATVYGDAVYVRGLQGNYKTDGIRLSARTGALLGGFNSQYSPVFAGPTAFYTETYTVTAVDIATGATRWVAVAPAEQEYACAPLIANDVLYVTSVGGMIFGYRVTTGQRLFAAALPQPAICYEGQNSVLTGLGAGDGLLLVPAGNVLVAYQ